MIYKSFGPKSLTFKLALEASAAFSGADHSYVATGLTISGNGVK